MDQATGTLLDDPRFPRGPLNVGDYYRLAEEGVIPPDARVELIEGELVRRSAVGSPHARAVKRLLRCFAARIGSRALLSVQDPVRLDEGNEPQPDVALLVPRADDYGDGHPSAADVLLLVEVADSTLALDRGRKRALYARHGVREYWIVNIDAGEIEVCRGPTPSGYVGITVAGLQAVVTVDALPGVAVPVGDILG